MNSISFFAILAAMFACTGFWEFLRYLISSRRKQHSAVEEAVLAIVHELIYPQLEVCILRGSVGLEEFDRITQLYKPYERLGGNGTVKRRYEIVKDLPRFDDRADVKEIIPN